MGMGTAVFTGFALWLGIDETRIPLFTTMGYLLAVLQMLSPILGRYIRNIKRLVLAGGAVEILFRSSLILIPYLLSSKYHLPALVILVALGLMPGYAISPFFNTWLANSIPKNIRARFTSQQTMPALLFRWLSVLQWDSFLISSMLLRNRSVSITFSFLGPYLGGWDT